MIDVASIFRYKAPNQAKLAAYGFAVAGSAYRKEIPILQKQFHMIVTVEGDGSVRFKVMETALNEEYALVHVEQAQGGFVGEVRDACEKVLVDLSNRCFDTEILKAGQTKRALAHIQDAYGVAPEFLWEKSPDCAAFRRPDNAKWFAVVMTVDRSKLGLPGHGNVEIMDLKDGPERIEGRLDGKRFFSAYHMNKKHWFTVLLDGSVPDDELFALIASSYERTK